MRRAVRTFALLCVTLAVAGMWLFIWSWPGEPIVFGNTGVYLSQIEAALGAVVALATVVVGLVAMARRRHWGWLSGLIVAELLSAGGSGMAVFVIQTFLFYPRDIDPCPTYPNCAPPPPQWLPLPFQAAPMVVALVVLLYFCVRMLRASPPTPSPRS